MQNCEQREFPLSDRDFATIAQVVGEETGIVLGERKRDLVYGRLVRRLRALKCPAFGEYCHMLEGPEGEAEREAMLNAITTNLTQFFREPHHFEHLGTAAWAGFAGSRRGSRRVRIWSAGCSSGEEAYSIAMTVLWAMRGRTEWDVKILATDLDTDMVASARRGHYGSDRVATIPHALRQRYVRTDPYGGVEMTDDVRGLVVFNRLNLLEPWPMRRPFDAIFCRNVLIYFDTATKCAVLDRFAEALAPGGWLYVGHSESLFRVSDRFSHVGRTIYRRIG